MVCANCGVENRTGRRFCSSCGSPLGAGCPTCGAENEPGDRFCGACGAPLDAPSAPATVPSTAGDEADERDGAGRAATERKLVSVLFADLVGFTALSERRDAEEVRELLGRYFDACRRSIRRYGGTVEKFIGDAVMAVWGTPTAREDDAERAVRAGLDLAEAVVALGAELGAPELRARVGVTTGEAAVTVGATAQGMVAGDLVNTASRVQSAAEPGAVLVGDATRRATDAAIGYQDAGSHELKGKAEPVRLWRAVRVIAGIGGALRSAGLEAPFVGRDRELRLVKELFLASADEGKAHLVAVLGIAGIGKSRLSWEFFKYIDGLADNVWWHRGRCLAYGEGVTYWALAEMVRMRARIDEGDELEAALAKLRQALERHVLDPEERRWIEPRLAHLLGLEERIAADPKDLFSAWRLFFERLADESPTVLVVEDVQWADAALLDFIEYLLDWSRDHPLFVMLLARPELAERHPNRPAGKRNFTSLSLEPLPAAAMGQLLNGLVPGLPDEVRGTIEERAEGVPLYAVETVRMLLDRGLLVRDGDVYHPARPIGELDVPETLHALIAARLDGLPTAERTILQDASVLGKTFSVDGLVGITGSTPPDVEPLLASLVRKEILSFQTDPRSLERGQYAFLQDLLRWVAYETLSRRERRARHLAVAGYLESAWGSDDDELVEILASHYLDAYRAVPNADDANAIRTKARDALAGAGARAGSLLAYAEAQRYFDQAIELADDDVARAELSERAAEMAYAGGRAEEGRTRFERAAELFRSAGLTHPAARVSAKLGELLWMLLNRLDDAVELMESSLAVLAEDAIDADTAMLMAQAARLHYFRGELDLAASWVDRALDAAEELVLPETLAHALNTKGILLQVAGHGEEGFALQKGALDIALQHDLSAAAGRALNNLANHLHQRDRFEEAMGFDLRNLELATRRGDRVDLWYATTHVVMNDAALGRWDHAMETASTLTGAEDADDADFMRAFLSALAIPVLAWRGQIDAAAGRLADLDRVPSTTEVQDQNYRVLMRAVVRFAEGRHGDALAAAEASLALRDRLGGLPSVNSLFAPGYTLALWAAYELGRFDRVEELCAVALAAPPRDRTPSIEAAVARFQGRLAAARGEPDAGLRLMSRATGLLRGIGAAFWLAVTQLEAGEMLMGDARVEGSRPLLEEAGATFERLGARPWLERVRAAEGSVVGRTAVG